MCDARAVCRENTTPTAVQHNSSAVNTIVFSFLEGKIRDVFFNLFDIYINCVSFEAIMSASYRTAFTEKLGFS